jgi:ribosomal protein S18 acetylase RimI-like enzyme
MDIKIRTCQLDDIKEIYLLNKEELGYDYPIDKQKIKLEQLLESSSDRIYVACIDNQVVGYVHAASYDTLYMDHLKNILGIAVKSKYRHLGIGKRLLTEVEIWAKEDNAAGIRLVSGETRVGAHEFYKKCGYTCHKRQMYFMKMIK